MLTCQEATALIAEAIDGAAAPRALDPLRQHLAICDRCRDEFETQFDVRRVLASRSEEAVPPGFGERLAARLAVEPAPRKGSAFGPGQAPWEYTDDLWPAGGPPFVPAQEVRSSGTALDALPWRTWSLRFLPLAAVLLIFVLRENLRDPAQRPIQGPADASVAAPAAAPLAAPVSAGDSAAIGPAAATSPAPAVPAVTTGPTRPAVPTSPPSASTPAASVATKATAPQPEPPAAPRPPASSIAVASSPPASPAASAVGRGATGAASGTSASPDVATNSASISPGRPAAAPQATPAPSLAAATPAPPVPAPQLLEPVVPTRLASVVAQELGLSEAQRKQIEAIYNAQRNVRAEILDRTRERFERQRRDTDAAIERILTPEQRRQYRELNGSAAPGLRPGAIGAPGDGSHPSLPASPPPARLDPTPPPPPLR